MVQESGRIRPSEKAPTGKPAAARRAANEAHDTLRRFASCLVSGAEASRERRDLAAFLRTSAEDPALGARTNKILRENCVFGTGSDSTLLRFSPDLLRGAIFRQLYLDLGTKAAPVVSRGDISTIWSPDVRGAFAANRRFGDCLVTADRAAADGFVRAKVASAEQDTSLQRVMARMTGCLGQGLTLQMSRAVLDGVLAEALYRQSTGSDLVERPDRSRVAQEQ
jgi:hypothetical protein